MERKTKGHMQKTNQMLSTTNNISKITLNEEKEKTDKMTLIASSLERVDPDLNKSLYDMASTMSESEIIVLFNQTALDFFTFAINGTKRLNREREFGFAGYLSLYQSAIKANIGVPIDKFTILILEFAPDIYSVNEKFFLDMEIPDIKIDTSTDQSKKNTDNEFNMIQSKEFKKLWLVLSQSDKDQVKEKIQSLTTYAHAYFFKLCMAKK